MISAAILSLAICSLALSGTMAPPGQPVVNHAHPGHYAQPTIRVFERRGEDRDRRIAWEAYCKELDQLWAEYRAAGSTPVAWQKYNDAAGQARRRYVYQDPYLMPIVAE